MKMTDFKKVLDWDDYKEPKRTEIYRLLNAAAWIACSEYGESMNCLIPFLRKFISDHPEWKDDLIDALVTE